MTRRPAIDTAADPGTLDPLTAVRDHVDALLRDFLTRRKQQLVAIDPQLLPVAEAVARLVLAGGKRIRPAFVYWGYRAGGAGHTAQLWNAAAAVELLQTFALIHDDVMDRSSRRRGQPTTHVVLEAHHRSGGLAGDAEWFGIGGAILAGDLAFVWADELFDATPLPAAARDRARAVFTELRTELMAGQYLDLVLASTLDAQVAQARRVALLKAGRYTVTRPLQLGAAIAGADPALDAALVAYGDAVGVAFQLRDDILGLFGNPGSTGKSVLDDLRQGKRTVLMLQALEMASPPQRAVLESALGRGDVDDRAADEVRTVVRDCGALTTVEAQVSVSFEQAVAALVAVPQPARVALEHLAAQALFRDG
jgi:geranylgeranyl diphosphate synthase type I